MEEKFPTSLSGIFTDALMIEDSGEQESFILNACGSDSALLTEVRELLESHAVTSGSFSRPFGVIPELKEGRSGKNAPDPWLDLPKAFGNYLLEEIIGQGGMGMIYRATQVQLNRVVALKMIRNGHLATRKEIQRFYSEAQSAARLNHHGVIPIIETGEVDGQHFFSMGYVDGMNLAEAVKAKLLNRAQVGFIIESVVAALAYTHREGVIHRDLKPENILLSRLGHDQSARDYYRPHISDFGLAKILHQSHELTLAGEIFGTPSYMSPEQAAGHVEDVGPASDIYAAGAVMYFALTGQPPFEGKNVWAVLKQVENEEPPRPTHIQPSIPQDLETICLKCLAKDPAQRYPTADHLQQDLENHRFKRPLLAKRANFLRRAIKLCQRNPTRTVASILSTLLFGVIFLLSREIQSRANQPPPEPIFAGARTEFSRAMQLAVEGNQSGALQSFVSTATLAHATKDEETEHLARYSIGALRNELWSLEASVPFSEQIVLMKASLDGRSLATTSGVGSLRVINLRTQAWQLDTTLDSKITALAFHPNNQVLVAACQDRSLHIWKREGDQFVKNGQLHLKLDAGIVSEHPIHSMGFTSGGEHLFTASLDKKIRFWDLESRSLLAQHLQHTEPLLKVELAREANLLVSFGTKGAIYGWDASTRQRRFGPVVLHPDILSGSVDPAGRSVVITTSTRANPQIYDLSRCGPLTTELPADNRLGRGSQETIFNHSSNSGILLALHPNSTLHFHAPRTLREQSLPLRFRTAISNFILTRQETLLCTLHPEIQTILIWRAPRTWKNGIDLPTKSASKHLLVSKGRGAPVISSDGEDALIFPSPAVWLRLGADFFNPSRVALGGPIKAGIFHPERSEAYLLIQSSPPTLLCLETNSKKILWKLPHPHEEEVRMNLSPKGDQLLLLAPGVTNTRTDNISVVNLSGTNVEPKLKNYRVPAREFRAGGFSSMSDDLIVLASDRKGIIWYDLEAEEIIRERSLAPTLVNALDIDAKRGLVVVGGTDLEARVYAEKTWEQVSPRVRHSFPVTEVKFARNGELVLSGGGGSDTAKLWETRSGLAIGGALGHDAPINKIQICESSESVSTTSIDGILKIWPLPEKDERALDTLDAALNEEFPVEF